MCDICRQPICPSGCPNADEVVVAHCAGCDEEVYVGDNIVKIDGDIWHEECLKDLSISELVQLFDCEVEVAEEDVWAR